MTQTIVVPSPRKPLTVLRLLVLMSATVVALYAFSAILFPAWTESLWRGSLLTHVGIPSLLVAIQENIGLPFFEDFRSPILYASVLILAPAIIHIMWKKGYPLIRRGFSVFRMEIEDITDTKKRSERVASSLLMVLLSLGIILLAVLMITVSIWLGAATLSVLVEFVWSLFAISVGWGSWVIPNSLSFLISAPFLPTIQWTIIALGLLGWIVMIYLVVRAFRATKTSDAPITERESE